MNIENFFSFAEEFKQLLPSNAPYSSTDSFSFETLVSDTGLRNVVCSLFWHGHFAQAIEEALKFLDNLVADSAGVNESGARLMNQVFSINKPILKFNSLSTQSEKDEQQGLMMAAAGLMTGLRNPRAHDSNRKDDLSDAIAILTFVNYLVLRVRQAQHH